MERFDFFSSLLAVRLSAVMRLSSFLLNISVSNLDANLGYFIKN